MKLTLDQQQQPRQEQDLNPGLPDEEPVLYPLLHKLTLYDSTIGILVEEGNVLLNGILQ